MENLLKIRPVFFNKIPNHFFVALSAWTSRIIIAVIQIFAIKIILPYLGAERYAVYVVIFSISAWFGLADFGVGTSLQNYISESRVKNEDYKKYMTAGLQIMAIGTILSFILLFLFSEYMQNKIFAKYLHINELKTVNIILLSGIFFITMTIVNVSGKIYYALHKGVVPNLLQALAYIISFVCMLFVTKFFKNAGILNILLCFTLPQILLMAVPFIKIFKNSILNIFDFDIEILKRIFVRSVKFSGLVFMSLAVMQIDYVIMARTIDASSITSYNIFNKMFMFAFYMYSSFLGAFWPTSSELFHSKNYATLNRLLKKYFYLGIIMMLLFITAVFIFRNLLIDFFASDMDIKVTLSFFVFFGIYYILRVISETYSTFLQSINILKIFWIYTPIQAVISIIAQYFLSMKYGINGIILGLILSFALTCFWILPYKSYKIFKSVKQINI